VWPLTFRTSLGLRTLDGKTPVPNLKLVSRAGLAGHVQETIVLESRRFPQEPDRALLSSKEPMRRAIPLALVLLLVGAPCSLVKGNGGGQDGNAGIRGIVLLGPMCPVERVGSPCPDRPIAAEVSVSGPQGQATVRSGSDGRFRIALAPGRYTLRAAGPSSIQYSKPVGVSVFFRHWTTTTVLVDSGIR
jgi:hypothetical protein